MDEKLWDFDSGHLVLDFANTAEFHASQEPDERLETYQDYVSWSQAAGLLTKQESQSLLESAAQNPGQAARALHGALELREIIYHIFSSAAHGQPPGGRELAAFNSRLSQALANSRITTSGDKFSWSWSEDKDPADRTLWILVKETASLVTSREVKRVGQCADDRGCGYLFIDTSRNHSRRWCSMESCGNRAKAKRHYHKRTGKQTPPQL